jgi:hypothetical protein
MLVKVTVRPVPAVASSASAVAVALSVVGGLKLMVCSALEILMDLVILVAKYLSSWAWEAVITHDPAAKTVKELPLSIWQIEVEAGATTKVTGAEPAPFVALSSCGTLSIFIAVGAKAVMLWATLVIVIFAS